MYVHCIHTMFKIMKNLATTLSYLLPPPSPHPQPCQPTYTYTIFYTKKKHKNKKNVFLVHLLSY